MTRKGWMIWAMVSLFPMHFTAAAQTCPPDRFFQLMQVTDGFSQSLQTDAAGEHVVWEGDADPLGANPDRNMEIFLYDVQAATLTQITRTAPGSDGQSPDLSADGQWVAFEAGGDLVGGNADGNGEIFVYRRTTGEITQVTDTVVGAFNAWPHAWPRLSADGSRLVFISEADLTGSNADGNRELFYTDDRGASFVQVTDTSSANRSPYFPEIDYLGHHIAFSSRNDFTGANADRNEELFVFNIPSGRFTQVTHSSGSCGNQVPGDEGPAFDLSGNLLVFMSDCNFTGQNPDGSFEAYFADLTSGTIEQLTDSSLNSFAQSISGNGQRVALFSWGADHAGRNADGSWEVFIYDRTDRTFTQVTDGMEGSFAYRGSLNVDGTALAFTADANLTGGNADRNDEPFLGVCRLNTPVPVGTSGFFAQDPVWFPMLHSDTPQIRPLGLGSVAMGGSSLNLRVRSGRFAELMDCLPGRLLPFPAPGDPLSRHRGAGCKPPPGGLSPGGPIPSRFSRNPSSVRSRSLSFPPAPIPLPCWRPRPDR